MVTNGWGLLELRSQQMSLEDIFLQLTTEEIGDEPGSVSSELVSGTEPDHGSEEQTHG